MLLVMLLVLPLQNLVAVIRRAMKLVMPSVMLHLVARWCRYRSW